VRSLLDRSHSEYAWVREQLALLHEAKAMRSWKAGWRSLAKVWPTGDPLWPGEGWAHLRDAALEHQQAAQLRAN
jgi:hypothetical protein